MKNVAIIGASEKSWRYSCKAQKLLVEMGYPVLPVASDGQDVMGLRGYAEIGSIEEPVDTVTIYVRSEILENLVQGIIDKKPRRAIFNPGSESAEAMQKMRDAGIHVLEACTLVLLRTGQFDDA